MYRGLATFPSRKQASKLSFPSVAYSSSSSKPVLCLMDECTYELDSTVLLHNNVKMYTTNLASL